LSKQNSYSDNIHASTLYLQMHIFICLCSVYFLLIQNILAKKKIIAGDFPQCHGLHGNSSKSFQRK